ncbi:MAG: AraC family transcriptional regulator [Eubacteriales bacterium]|nr:AraC family transcriptional regulator [Eubacteriales bacterium]
MDQLSAKELFSLPKSFPFTIYHASIPDQGVRTMLWHDCLELNYVVSGGGHYVISDVRYEVKPGQIFVINNNELHCAYTTKSLELICIIFEPGFVTGSTLVDREYLEPFFDRNVNFQNLIGADNPLAQTIRDLVFEIENENSQHAEGYQLITKASLLRILALLFRYFKLEGQLGLNFVVNQNRLDRIREAVTYIDANYMTKINLETIAQRVFMNPSYFSTYFKRVMKISVMDYVANLRMTEASSMLCHSIVPITEVGLTCGYPTTAYFSRAFRKAFGTSPSQYRKLNLQVPKI